jgi:hypothetical protein
VLYDELILDPLVLVKVAMFPFIVRQQLIKEGFVGSLGETTLFIKQVDNSRLWLELFDQINSFLIVFESDL